MGKERTLKGGKIEESEAETDLINRGLYKITLPGKVCLKVSKEDPILIPLRNVYKHKKRYMLTCSKLG